MLNPFKSPRESSESKKRGAVRPLPLLVLGVCVCALIWLWGFSAFTRDFRFVGTYIIGLTVYLTISIWLLMVRTRVWIAAPVIAVPPLLLAVGFGLFRVDTFDGDMIPTRFTWRWEAKPHETLSSKVQTGEQAEEELRASATDFPQFLGPDRSGILTGLELDPDWKNNPPQQLWRQDFGAGWSGFAVVGGYAWTQEMRGEKEFVSCFDVETGELVWRQPDRLDEEPGFISAVGGDGPRSTPTLADGKVYTMGGTGVLNCFAADTGERLWSHNVLEENEAEVPKWGHTCSPLLVENLVIVTGGGTAGPAVLAFDRDSGEEVWTAGEQGVMSDVYASPLLTAIDGEPQVLIQCDQQVLSVSPETGEELWTAPWPWAAAHHPKPAQPQHVGDGRILLTASYGSGSAMLQVSRDEDGRFIASEGQVWEKNRNLKCKFTNPVKLGRYVYGLDNSVLVCLDLETGERVWKGGRYGHGQLLLVGEVLLIQTEPGDVALVQATPEGLEELTRFTPLFSRTWNYPTLAGDLLLVRNDREAVCYRVQLKRVAQPP